MPILSVQPDQAGQSGVLPSIIYILTNDTIAEVTTAGYLNGLVSSNIPLREEMMALVTTKTTPNATSTQVAWLEVTKSGDNWSLTSSNGPGSVTLPTIQNHIAVYNNTTGGLGEDAATAINGGNIQAGLSGTAGFLASFPPTAASGSLRLVAANNAGDTVTQITNASMGQATVLTIPDPAAATANMLVAPAALVNNNLVKASGIAGLVVDAGARLISGVTAVYGGGGTSNAFAVVGLSATAHGSAVIRTSTNAVSIVSAVPGTNTLTVTFSADPGANTTVDYIYTTAPQT